MTVVFREATRDDIPAVVELLREDVLGNKRELASIETYLTAFDAMMAMPGNRLIVGDNGQVVACYQLTIIPGVSLGASTRAQIEGIRVSDDLRGQGVGAALMADAEMRAKNAGASLIQLTTNKTRTDAHRFYDRAGYVASHTGYKKPLA